MTQIRFTGKGRQLVEEVLALRQELVTATGKRRAEINARLDELSREYDMDVRA